MRGKLLIAAFISSLLLGLNAQQYEWARKGGLWAYDYGYGITTDNYGRVYIAGKYEKNANFSGTILPCQGNHDIYLAQYSASGTLNWIRTAGGYTGDYATCVATDGTDYVYIGGEIQGSNATIKFVGSPITLKCQGSNDIVIAKYTLSGTLVWARRAGGPYYEKALGITVDKNNNIYVCGLFTKYAKFGSSTTIYGSGDRDIFIAKYDANGNFIWVRSASGPLGDEANEVSCDDEGNVYITGFYRDGCKFGSQTFSSPNGKKNLFLAKYSPSGSLLWVRTGGGPYNDEGYGVVCHKGLIYVSGEFNSTAYFNGNKIYTTGSGDVLVACYDKSGNVRWLRRAGGKTLDRARGIGASGGKLFITGQYSGTAYFGSISKTAVDARDIFVACLDTLGNYEWVMTAGGPADLEEDLGYESGIAVCAEENGNVYATGAMLNGATFGSTVLKPWTRTDVYLVKIKAAPFATDNISAAGTDSTNAGETFNPQIALSGNALFAGQVNVFPNPSSGTFSLKVDGELKNDIEFYIINSAGQTVMRQKFSGSEVLIDLSEHEKGMYMIVVMNGTLAARKKLIVK